MPRRPLLTRAMVLLLLLLLPTAMTMTAAAATRDDDVTADFERRTKLVQWLAGPRTWAELPKITAALEDDAVEVRAAALVTAMRLWDANQALANPERMSLVLDWRQADHFLAFL